MTVCTSADLPLIVGSGLPAGPLDNPTSGPANWPPMPVPLQASGELVNSQDDRPGTQRLGGRVVTGPAFFCCRPARREGALARRLAKPRSTWVGEKLRRGHRVDRHQRSEWGAPRADAGLTAQLRLLGFVALLRRSLASSRLPAPYRVPLDFAAGAGGHPGPMSLFRHVEARARSRDAPEMLQRCSKMVAPTSRPGTVPDAVTTFSLPQQSRHIGHDDPFCAAATDPS